MYVEVMENNKELTCLFFSFPSELLAHFKE